MNCMIMSVIIGHNGTETKGFKKRFGRPTAKPFSVCTTKTYIVRLSHMVRKVLQSEACSLRGGDHRPALVQEKYMFLEEKFK